LTTAKFIVFFEEKAATNAQKSPEHHAQEFLADPCKTNQEREMADEIALTQK